jgi:hypothetical protein
MGEGQVMPGGGRRVRAAGREGGSRGFNGHRRRNGVFNEPDSHPVDLAKFGFGGVVLGEFHEVAAGEELLEQLLNGLRKALLGSKFGEELLGGPVGGVPAEPALQIITEDGGNLGAERSGIAEKRKRRFEPAAGQFVGRDGRWAAVDPPGREALGVGATTSGRGTRQRRAGRPLFPRTAVGPTER